MMSVFICILFTSVLFKHSPFGGEHTCIASTFSFFKIRMLTTLHVQPEKYLKAITNAKENKYEL